MIEIKFDKNNNKSIAYDVDTKIGECEFIEQNECWNIRHTEVSNSYQGQGIARRLVENIIEKANQYNKKLVAECSYAKKVIEESKKKRIAHLNSTVCYLKKDNKVLMIKFTKKWGKVYAPPGGKFEEGETPLDCILREYYEETGLKLINPRLQGMSYWKDKAEGIIFVYVAEDFEGDLKELSEEGCLEWIKEEDLSKLKQFSQNEKFTSYLFKKELFEGKFLLDEKCNVIEYKIRKI